MPTTVHNAGTKESRTRAAFLVDEIKATAKLKRVARCVICHIKLLASSLSRQQLSQTSQLDGTGGDEEKRSLPQILRLRRPSSDQSCHIFGKENAFLVLQAQNVTPAAPGPAARLPRAATSSHIGSAAQYAAARIADPTLDAHPRQSAPKRSCRPTASFVQPRTRRCEQRPVRRACRC